MELDTQTQHPNPQPNPHHRKIDLQTPEDLIYLQGNLASSALQKLDLHFPKISKPATHISLDASSSNPTTTNQDDDGEEPDPMRLRVHNLVSEFLNTTWTSAAHNLTVNGIDASSIPIPHTATLSPAPPPSSDRAEARPQTEIEGIHFKHEAFDASLQHKLAALYGELESLTAQVSKLRRTAPSQGAEAHRAQLRAAMDADDERFQVEMEYVRGQNVAGLEIESVAPGWNEDVREIYERGVEELASLAGAGQAVSSREPSLTETVGKAQRARTVTMELE